MQKIFVFTSAGHPVSGTARLVAFVVRWLINAVAVWLAAELVDGIHLDGWQTTLTVALFLGILNQFVKPFLVFIGLPFIVLTLGLFLVLINTALWGWLSGSPATSIPSTSPSMASGMRSGAQSSSASRAPYSVSS